MYAKVIIEYPIKSLDKTFTYLVPSELKNIIKVGMKVKIPFASKMINGIVLEISNICNEDYELKSISKIIDSELVFNNELLELGNYMHEKLLCTKISAYQAMLPAAFKVKDKKTSYDKFVKYIVLSISHNEALNYIKTNYRNRKQIEIINLLMEQEQVLKSDISGISLNTLLQKNIVKEISIQKYRINKMEIKPNTTVLTPEQKKVHAAIKESLDNNTVFLLKGVTGSGKTEVYLKLIEDVLSIGKTAIMLVPEISLTAQITNRFYDIFGDKVAVLHSGLSDGEKHDEYLKIIRGEVNVVVGTRSAIFAPITNLGIILIDEEHSDSYKQDNTPKYNAKDIALFRAKYHHIPLVLASATPKLETMARAQKGVYKLLELKNRIGNSLLPKITLLDMQEEYKKQNFIFSNLLKENINKALLANEQVMLFLNRRGFSTFINCSNCGFTYKCPNCDISLIYHKTTQNLICHYCGYQKKIAKLCPNCNEDGLKYLGLGTEKLEEEINKEFPLAKVVRMDQDTTSKKGMHEKIISDFKNNKYNILLGTSMISKGLDFPNVTLVGVLNADLSLNIPDFRSNENTFSLLNQVSGRAGRREKVGNVIIQTFNPDNPVLKYVQDNNYDDFYKYEMDFRKKLKYPPYYYLISVKIMSQDYNLALEKSQRVIKYLKNNLDQTTICLGPTTAAILKFKKNYRFQIIIKYRFDTNIYSVLRELDNIFALNKKISIDIDVDPFHI